MKRHALGYTLIGVMALVVGCAQRQPGAVVADLLPDQVAALRRLDVFVGRWAVHGTIRRPRDDPPLALTGENEVRWDGHLLIARGRATVEGVDSTAVSMLTYDPIGKIYRAVSISPNGSVAIGTAEHDDQAAILRGRHDSVGPDGAMTWEGEVRWVDPNTKAERWVGYPAGSSSEEKVVIEKTEQRLR